MINKTKVQELINKYMLSESDAVSVAMGNMKLETALEKLKHQEMRSEGKIQKSYNPNSTEVRNPRFMQGGRMGSRR